MRPKEAMKRHGHVGSTLAFALAAAFGASTGCNGGADAVDCATATVKPFSELKSEFSQCTSCHGGRRADSGYRYDNYDDAAQGASAAADAIGSGSMPPDEDLSDAAANAINAWALCGTPE